MYNCEVVLFGLNIIIAVRMLDIGEIFGEDDGFERYKNFKVFCKNTCVADSLRQQTYTQQKNR